MNRVEGASNPDRPKRIAWEKIKLPLIPETARQCADYLFGNLSVNECTAQIQHLHEIYPELLKALMDNPTFNSALSGIMIPVLRAMPQEYKNLILKLAATGNPKPEQSGSIKDFFDRKP